jgi:hypothetical protein
MISISFDQLVNRSQHRAISEVSWKEWRILSALVHPSRKLRTVRTTSVLFGDETVHFLRDKPVQTCSKFRSQNPITQKIETARYLHNLDLAQSKSRMQSRESLCHVVLKCNSEYGHFRKGLDRAMLTTAMPRRDSLMLQLLEVPFQPQVAVLAVQGLDQPVPMAASALRRL